MGQSARSFQGNYLWTFPDACQYLRALCRRKIPRFLFSGTRVSEKARPLARTIQSEQQRAKQKSSCAVSCLHSLAEPPGVRPHNLRPSAAARAGAAAAKLGCENGLKRAQKVLLRLQTSPVSSWPPATAAIAAKVAAAARADRLRVPEVCLGDSARRGRARGRCGDSGCLGGPSFPSLGGCGGHWGRQQHGGHTHAFRAPPAR